MSAWDSYSEKMSAIGQSQREMRLTRTKETIARRIKHSLSYKNVVINGFSASVAVTRTPEKSEKNIFSLPGEHIPHGGLVEYADGIWLITEVDDSNEVYDKGLMRRCNHVLRWRSSNGTVKEKWCVVEDGTKYLIGEKASQVLTIGDSRVALTVGKDCDTVELKRGMRFLINDTDSDEPLAYQITKSNKLFNVYNGVGVFRFILNEVESIPEDDYDGRIAGATDWTLNRGLDNGYTDSAMSVSEIREALDDDTYTPPERDKEVWL